MKVFLLVSLCFPGVIITPQVLALGIPNIAGAGGAQPPSLPGGNVSSLTGGNNSITSVVGGVFNGTSSVVTGIANGTSSTLGQLASALGLSDLLKYGE